INPLLYFVTRFDVFKLENDALGLAVDKGHTFETALKFVCLVSSEIDLEGKDKWLLYKDTYINDFGTVRKEKGFIKKCIECTDNDKFRAIFSAMAGNVDELQAKRAQVQEQRRNEDKQRWQEEEQCRREAQQAEEQRKFNEQQLDMQKKLIEQQKCMSTTCLSCTHRGTAFCTYSPNGVGGCYHYRCT
ncbi:MAG: hypothetical protein K2L88_07225, partial [Clostridiales bacterium]|nr:hypothetical protein [Clostridiales bacterium]